MSIVEIRDYRPGDGPALGRVFARSIHEGAVARYSSKERAAWCPTPPLGPDWDARLDAIETLVALRDGVPVGFMALDMRRASLELAYVVPEVQGGGVASALWAILEGRARVQGLARLTTDASLVAEPFFHKHGWTVSSRQTVLRNSVPLENATMHKNLIVESAA
ncbi:MAG: GNAT family N-acetyltransferase [Pseudomonadota bacterium]